MASLNQPRATPAGFMLDAIEFQKAAELLLNRTAGISLPIYFLFARAIELCLKSFLLHSGVSARDLAKKELGHNLFALIEESSKRSLEGFVDLSRQDFGMLDLLGQEYQGTRLGYRVSEATYYLPPIDQIERIARKLIAALDQVSRGSPANTDA